MKTKTLVIVTGCPGSGKSSFAQRLSRAFPESRLYSYDRLKERYFDRCGFDNEEEKTRLNEQSLQEFYRILDREMAAGEPLIIEYPFCKKHESTLRDLTERHGYRAVTLLLTGELPVLYQRGVQRDQGAGRHPGHLLRRYHKGQPWPAGDLEPVMDYASFAASCAEKDYNICVGKTLRVDVTDMDAVDTEALWKAVRQALSEDA